MQSPLKISTVCLVLAATLSLPMAAMAQTPPLPPNQSHTHQSAKHAAPDRVEQRIADLRAGLHITPEQQAPWDQFAQVMRDNAQHMRQTAEDRATRLKTMNASENMSSYAQIAMQHAQDVQNLATAFQPLYASLSQDQQRAADAMFRNVGIPHKRSGKRH